MPSFDGSDDFVGVFGPGKGPGVCIGVIEETVDGIFEFLEGAEHAALEALFGEFRKEALDGEADAGVKWKTNRGWFSIHSRTLGCLRAA